MKEMGEVCWSASPNNGFEHEITAINVVAVSLSLADYLSILPVPQSGSKRGQPTNHVGDVLSIMIHLRNEVLGRVSRAIGKPDYAGPRAVRSHIALRYVRPKQIALTRLHGIIKALALAVIRSSFTHRNCHNQSSNN